MTELVPGDVAHAAPDTTAGEPPLLYTVTLDGVQYPISLEQYRHQGLPSIREGVTTAGDPSESLFDHTGTWWRHRFDWTHGAGQTIGDFLEAANDRQFNESLNIDNTDLLGISLARPYAPISAHPTRVLDALMSSGPYLNILLSGVNALYFSAISSALAVAGYATMTGFTGVGPVSLAAFGRRIYVACGNVISVCDTGTGAQVATIGDPVQGYYRRVWAVGGRILAARGTIVSPNASVLIDVGAATETVIADRLNTGFVWTDAAAIGSLIYVGGTTGNADLALPAPVNYGATSEIYGLTTTSTGTLVIGPQSAPFGAGEVLIGMESHAGLLVLATTAGLRLAQPAGDGTLTYGPLFATELIAVLNIYVGRMASSDGHVWVPISQVLPLTSTDPQAFLIRLDLDTFTAPLVPAYTVDVQPPRVTGTKYYMDKAVSIGGGHSPFITMIRDKAADDYPIMGPVQSGSIYESDGFVSSGVLYFGTLEQKRLTSLIVRFDALPAGCTVVATVTDQDGTTVATGTSSTDNATGLVIDIDGAIVDWCEVTIALAGDGTATPTVTSWEIRGYPVTTTTEQWLVPLLVQSKTTVGGGQGQELVQNPLERLQAIEDLFRSKEAVIYREGDRSRRVRVDNFQVEAPRWVTSGLEADYFEMVVLVQLLSV